MLWEYLREEEFAPAIEKAHGVCAFAIGCLEMHGQHLPLGTDTLKGGKILEMAAEQEEVVVFPRFYFGDLQSSHSTSPVTEGNHYGYVCLSSELLIRLLRETCDEIGRNGFNKILIFSSHGGNNNMLGNFIRSMAAQKRPYEIFTLYNKLVMPKDILKEIDLRGRDAFPSLTDGDIAVLQDYVAQNKFDDHAGFGETALMLGTYPELVRMDKIEQLSGMSTHKADFLAEAGLQWAKTFKTNFPNAYSGHAAVGLTQSIADVATQLAVERTVKALKVLKNDALMATIL